MTTQLLLLDGGRPTRLMDARTRTTGRKGIAEARQRLAAVQPPQPQARGRELSQAS